ncbi:MAG: hypothetical protein LBI87_11675 [Candidatus Accumulibacter sp.]|nr:hypothetical protein [Accumulibacter sp.]
MNSQKVFLTIGVILMTVFGASALMAAETGRTKEIITLRGIPFDKPGVKDDVIKLCRQDYAQGVKNWSFFPKGKECSGQAIYFKFGNLDVDNDECSAGSLERTLRESVPRNIDERFISHILRCNAFIEFREDGALVSFEMRASPEKLSELAVLLTDKYGKPKAKFSKVANKVGGEFEQGEFTWVDIQGTTIFIQLRVNTVDEGSVRIMSASRLVESLDKKQQETAKQRGNL